MVELLLSGASWFPPGIESISGFSGSFWTLGMFLVYLCMELQDCLVCFLKLLSKSQCDLIFLVPRGTCTMLSMTHFIVLIYLLDKFSENCFFSSSYTYSATFHQEPLSNTRKKEVIQYLILIDQQLGLLSLTLP